MPMASHKNGMSFALKTFLNFYSWVYIYVNIYALVSKCLWRPEEGIESPGDGVTCVCDIGCWKPNPGPLQEKQAPVEPPQKTPEMNFWYF